MAILNLGGRGSEQDIGYEDGNIRLLNKLVEWRAHLSAEVDGDGNVIDKRVKDSEKTEDGLYVSHTDPASGFGVHIAAATGDADDASFERGSASKRIELGTAEDGPHPEIMKLVALAQAQAPGLDLDVTLDGGELVVSVIVTDKGGNADILNIKGDLAVDLAGAMPEIVPSDLITDLFAPELPEDVDGNIDPDDADWFADFVQGVEFAAKVSDKTIIVEDGGNQRLGGGDDIFLMAEGDAGVRFQIDSRDGSANGGPGPVDASLHVNTIIGFADSDSFSFRFDGRQENNGIKDLNGGMTLEEIASILNEAGDIAGSRSTYFERDGSTYMIFDDSPGQDGDEIGVVLAGYTAPDDLVV